MNKRNLGVFRINAQIVENKPDEVAEMFALLKIVPLKVEYRPDWDAYQYLAIGEGFPELKEHHPAPEYEIVVRKFNTSGFPVLVEAVRSE
ncbi:MAG: hypothetical protein E3J94_07260 [Desulfobacteraceae bacterium]|nr:MAG: hypothetical protein E3J94_07260 [Desulfobacteraceae bacterium]